MRRFQVIDEDFNEMGILETNLSAIKRRVQI